MSDDSHNQWLKAEQKKTEFQRTVERLPERLKWILRRNLERLKTGAGIYLGLSFIPALAATFGASWPEALSQQLLGLPFLFSWLGFALFPASLLIVAPASLFSKWYDKEKYTFMGPDAEREQLNTMERWQNEDLADAEKWVNHAASAGAVSVVTEHVDSGQLSEAEAPGQLSIQDIGLPTEKTE